MASQTKTKLRKPFRLSPLAAGITLALGICELRVTTAAENPGEPVGTEFQVNNTATAEQTSPAIAMDADGDFVVAWDGYGEIGEDYYGDPIMGFGIFARCYSNSGLPVDTEFPVDTSSTAGFPNAAMDADGNFVVVWDEEGANVYFRRYNERCEAVDNQRVPVNTTISSDLGEPSVAMDADGDFVVAWEGYGEIGEDYYGNPYFGPGIFARCYRNSGLPVDTEFPVDTAGSFEPPDVAMDANGNFVVVWEEGVEFADVYFRRYDESCETVDNQREHATSTTSVNNGEPKVAMDADGDFVVVWEGYGYDYYTGNFNDGVFARRYNEQGVAQETSEFQVNNFTTVNQSPHVAIDADGDFVVAWESYGNGNGNFNVDVFARRYNEQGVAQETSEFQVNNTATGFQSSPTVAMDADGDFAIAFRSLYQDGDSYGIFAQRFTGPEDVDLWVEVNGPLERVDPGGLFNYTFIVTNNHDPVAPTENQSINDAIGVSTGIKTIHTLPEGLSLESFSGNGWNCSQTARTSSQVDCTFSGTLLPATMTVTDLELNFDVMAPAAAEIVTTVTVTGDQYDSNGPNNTDTENTTIRPPDTTPEEDGEDQLEPFVAQTDITPNTVATSNAITVTGIEAEARTPISILDIENINIFDQLDPAYSIDSGPFTSEPGTVANGAEVVVRQTSWSEFSTTTNVTLVIGGVTRTFGVTTIAAPSGSTTTTNPTTEPTDTASTDSPTQPKENTPVQSPVSVTGESTTASSPDATPTSSGGGCTLGGKPAAAGFGWIEMLSLLLMSVFRRRKC
jgi:hypothetical protein